MLTAVLFWLTFALFIARQIRPALVSKLKNATRITVSLTIFSGAVLALQATGTFHSSVAVVTSAEATAQRAV